eukprot:9176249-Ditylum_brightwellii.AAC.1
MRMRQWQQLQQQRLPWRLWLLHGEGEETGAGVVSFHLDHVQTVVVCWMEISMHKGCSGS